MDVSRKLLEYLLFNYTQEYYRLRTVFVTTSQLPTMLKLCIHVTLKCVATSDTHDCQVIFFLYLNITHPKTYSIIVLPEISIFPVFLWGLIH